MGEESVDNDLLISLIEQHPVLWDKTMDAYKNRVATQAAWKQILISINPEVERKEEKERQTYAKLIIQRWTHIRDNYNRSYKKIQDQKRSGNGAKTAKPYVYSKQLSFLQKIMQPIETMSNVMTENNDKDSENQENNSEANEGSEINSIQATDTTTKNLTPKRIPKRPLKNDVNLVDAKMIKFMDSYLNQEPKVANRHLSFFNGILPTLESFDDNEVVEFQIGILQLLKKIKSSRQNRELPSLNVNYSGGSASNQRGYFSQEYQINNNSANMNPGSTNITPLQPIQASLQSPHSVDSSYSNYSDIIDYNDF